MRAVVVWLRDQMPQTEEGKQQWRQLVAWINTPPATPYAIPGEPPSRPVQPRGAPPGAPVDSRAQAAAFAASLSG